MVDDNILSLMVHRLEAQERTSDRLRDRAAMYVAFSFAVLGFYLGITASTSGLVGSHMAGTWVMIGVFSLAFITFQAIYRSGRIQVLPDPEALDLEADAERIPPAIKKAFANNKVFLGRDNRLVLVLQWLVVIQMACFIAVFVCDRS